MGRSIRRAICLALVLAASAEDDGRVSVHATSSSGAAQDQHPWVDEAAGHTRTPPPSLPGLWWFAPVLAGGGYCTEANTLLYGLDRLPPGPDRPSVRSSHHGDTVDAAYYRGLPREYYDLLNRLLMARFPPAKGSVVVCHSEPGAWSPAKYETSRCPPEGYGRDGALRVVGRTMFETDRLEKEHVARCNKMDEVWVPTAWSAGVFANAGVQREKIRIVPEAVDVDFYDPKKARQNPPFDLFGVARRVLGPSVGESGSAQERRVTKLLSIFKWEARKAPEVLLESYLSEFTADDDVALFVRCNLYHEQKDMVGDRIVQIARDMFTAAITDASSPPWGAPPGMTAEEALRTRAPRVLVLPRVRDADMPALYAAADALVLPSRGEGWGRPHVEAMAMALPVIATNWSGPTAFMTEDNSYPLSVEPKLVKVPKGHVFEKHYWAQPSVLHLRELMRRVVTAPEEAAARGEEARRTMVERFSPEAVARLVVEELRRIAREIQAEDNGTQKDEL